jgi:hypothetical protein
VLTLKIESELNDRKLSCSHVMHVFLLALVMHLLQVRVSSITASKILVGFWPLFFKLGEEERWDGLVPFFFEGARRGGGPT